MRSFWAALAALTILGAAAGGFFGMQVLATGRSAPAEHPPVSGHAAERAEAPPKPTATVAAVTRLVQLPPVIANLAGDKAPWIRVEASLLVEGDSKDGGVLAAQVSEDLVGFLRTVEARHFEGPQGFAALRDDLADRVRIRSKGSAKGLLIQGFVIE